MQYFILKNTYWNTWEGYDTKVLQYFVILLELTLIILSILDYLKYYDDGHFVVIDEEDEDIAIIS